MKSLNSKSEIRNPKQFLTVSIAFALGCGVLAFLSGCANINAKDCSSIGEYYFASAKNYTKAAKYYEEAVKETPKNADYLVMLGWAYFKLDRYDDAISAFERAEQANPKTVDAYTGQGWSYFKKLEFDRAVSYFEKAIEIDPYSADAYDGIGWASAKKGDDAKAETNFRLALQKALRYKKGVQKIDPEAHRGLGYLYFKQNRFRTALRYFKIATIFMPEWNDARVKWADCLFALKRYQAACIIYCEASKYAKTAEIYDKIGWCHCQLAKKSPTSSRCKIARGMFNKALAIIPDYPSSLSGLSEVSEIEKARWPQKEE